MTPVIHLDKSTVTDRPIPWFTFILLTVAFFIALHDPMRSYSIGDDYLPSEDALQKHASEGNVKRQIGFLIAGAYGCAILLFATRKKLQCNGILAALTLFFLAWIVLSLSWADDRSLTARRLVVVATLCVGALSIASSLTPREIMLFVMFSSTVYLFAGVLSEIALGSFTPTADRYRFAGTLHPNNQGVNCSLILLAAICAAHSEKRLKMMYVGLAGVALVFLMLTKSRTSLLSLVITALAYCVIVYGRSKHFVYVMILLTTAGLCVLLVAQDALMPAVENGLLMGRSDQDISGAMSLTGRLPLWQNLLEYAAQRPLQGYGYGSFFTVEHIREISDRQGWPIAECHSVFLEVLMGLGVIGVTSYALIQFAGIGRAIKYFRATHDVRYAFLGSLLLLGIIGGMSESTLLVPTMQTFVQFITLSFFAFVTVPEVVAARASQRDSNKFSRPPMRRPLAFGEHS